MRLMATFGVMTAGVALASSSVVAIAGPTQAAMPSKRVPAKGTITMTLKPTFAYLITDRHWVAKGRARVGIEPSGTPYPGPTVVFPIVSSDVKARVIHAQGGLLLGGSGIPVTGPTLRAKEPSRTARDLVPIPGSTTLCLDTMKGTTARCPFDGRDYALVGTDARGNSVYEAELYATTDAAVLSEFNDMSGLTGTQALKPGQRLGTLRVVGRET